MVLTTNHREKLDAALIRPGRIDIEAVLGNATPLQLEGLLKRFYPQEGARAGHIAADYPSKSLSPAQVQQILIAEDTLALAETQLRLAWAPIPLAGERPAAP